MSTRSGQGAKTLIRAKDKSGSMDSFTLMAVHAHPDDESMSTGGTLALYAQRGVRVVLVCATKGEEGENHLGDKGPALGELRSRELEHACRILGVKEIFFLGYRDSGMSGSPSNAHPKAFCNIPLREAASRLASLICEVRPHVMLTYNERGIYGHPDHVAAHRVTLLAVEMASTSSEPGLISWRVPRVFCIELRKDRLLRAQEALWGIGRSLPYPPEVIGTEHERIIAEVNVEVVLEKKIKAIICHRTQIGPNSLIKMLPAKVLKELLATECYSWATGTLPPTEKISDLFQMIT